MRRTLYTGRRGIPAYYFPQHENVQLPGWHALYHEDVTLSETLLEAGYINALISSLYHQFKPGRNFQRGFHTWEWIRGLEFDYYGTAPHRGFDIGELVSDEYLAKNPGLRELAKPIQSQPQSLAAARRIGQPDHSASGHPLAARELRREALLSSSGVFRSPRALGPAAPVSGKVHAQRARPELHRASVRHRLRYPTTSRARMRANYAGDVSCVDHWIGALLETIEQFGLAGKLGGGLHGRSRRHAGRA